MPGDRRPSPLNATAAQDTSGELRICINIPSLNRPASQELFWPSSIGRCEGHPHSYVCMPFGLPGTAASLQRCMRGVLASHEARSQAVLMEEEPEPPEPPKAQEPTGS